ncbi:MAG: LysR family transcriptional regulator [Hyphomonadaceae bacterium]|nr:LysR family transcriptional regulator [Hyphomonadaceae bacterium]
MTGRELPSLNAIRAFEAAARHHSMTHAAAELGVTAGAVSRQVRELEESLGRTLFVRGSKGLELTQAGEALSRSAGEAFDLLATATGGSRGSQARRLTIGVYGFFASRLLLPLWPQLKENLPGAEIDLHTSSDPLDLLPGRYDAVIGVGEDRPGKGMLVRPLVPITTVAVCAPDLARHGPLDFARARLLHARPRPDDWRRWLDYAGLSAVPVQKGSTFESIALALEAAAMGLGAAIAIEALIAGDLAAGKVMLAHPARRPTRRHFILQAEARHARDPHLLACADWLEAKLASPEPPHASPSDSAWPLGPGSAYDRPG